MADDIFFPADATVRTAATLESADMNFMGYDGSDLPLATTFANIKEAVREIGDAILVPYSEDDVDYGPSAAQLNAAFGTPASLGNGFVGTLSDDGSSTDAYICWTAGGTWFWSQGDQGK